MRRGPHRKGKLTDGAGNYPESYNEAKRARHANLGLVRCVRKAANLLAGISYRERAEMTFGDMAARIVGELAMLGALRLEACGWDEENEADQEEKDRSRERLTGELATRHPELYGPNPYARRRR